MGRHPTEACMKRTRDIVTGIKNSFNKLQGGTWLVAKRMDFAQDRTTTTYANHVLRALVEQKVLERIPNPTHKGGVEFLYRPTAAGYQLLDAVEGFPLDELHKRFANPRLQRKPKVKRARLPHGFTVRTMVGGSPEGQALDANQKFLLAQVNKLAAQVDALREQLANSDKVYGPPKSSQGNGLSQEVLAAIGRAVVEGRT